MKKGRNFVMGDIHGSYLALIECLKLCDFDYENDTLIQLGDVADGWIETPGCVEELMKIKNLISIRGNHDVWCWNWFTMGEQSIMWTQQGGQATIDAYIRTGLVADDRHKEFWNNQIDYYIDDDNRLFIHGGWYYLMGFPRGAEAPVGIRNAKECHWDRSLFESAKSAFHLGKNGKDVRFKALEEFKEVYIGHTAVHSQKPANFFNLWNLDTGAGWNGVLTIMDIDTKEYWQSQKSKDLYPNQRGR